MSAAGLPSASDLRLRRILGLPILGLLAVELLLGMFLNLYVSLPHGGTLAILEANPVLLLHIAVGVFLVGISVRVLLVGRRLSDRRALASGALGLLSSLAAFGAGIGFTFDGQAANASFAMTAGFVGILVAALLLLAPIAAATPEPGTVAAPE